VTAHKGEDDLRRALAAGCTNVLVKPVNRAALLATLFTALAPRSAAAGRPRGAK
jgi:CheY-like chemotaxis protein